jgi:23S rRNA pseudouridine1911/1915/1917 synthase
MIEIYKKFTPERYEVLLGVSEDEDGMRLDQFCALHLITFSRQQIKKKISNGEVKILDRPFPHKASVKVYHREKIELFTTRGTSEDEYWNGEKLELQLDPEIIHEDEQIVVISKPPYMCAHPTGRHLFNCATVYFENKYGHTVHSVHRLDRETSGVQLIGKNPKSANKCTTLFEHDKVSKCYFLMAHKKSQINFPFTANERLENKEDFLPRQYIHCFPEDGVTGKHAKTSYEELYQDDDYILALAFPRTGRQHQIRTHAAFHGFPLVGDKMYNGDPTVFMRFKDEVATKEDHDLMQISRHALHAVALKLPYPSEKEPSLFRSRIPDDFIDWIQRNLKNVDRDELETIIEKMIKEKFDAKI